jgi:hypothetical protein
MTIGAVKVDKIALLWERSRKQAIIPFKKTVNSAATLLIRRNNHGKNI